MRVFFRYAARETGSNLWRNRAMTFAALATVMVSLLLVGTALYAKQSAAQASSVWERETTTSVYMKPTATTAEIDTVRTELKLSPYVQGTCTYWDKEKNWQNAERTTPQSFLANLTAQDMPESFLCTPRIPTDVNLIISTFKNQPGVYQVNGPVQQVKSMEKTIRILQIVLLSISLVLLVSAIVLILTTIRQAIFARRREVSVMKLVGATNWFIRIPYIAEGFIQGLLGALVAAGLIAIFQAVVPLSVEYRISTSNVMVIDLLVLALGGLIGAVGSGIAIRRFLDV
jgi:cell division transport system permease protein